MGHVIMRPSDWLKAKNMYIRNLTCKEVNMGMNQLQSSPRVKLFSLKMGHVVTRPSDWLKAKNLYIRNLTF